MMTLLFAAAVAAVSPLTSGQHPHAAIAPGGYGFQLFVPRDAATGPANARSRWPLMIFLHGSGEQGSDLAAVKVNDPPKLVATNPDYPFVVVSPQLPAGLVAWDNARLDSLLDWALKSLPVEATKELGSDIERVQWQWPVSKPLVDGLGGGLYEVRTKVERMNLW